MLSANAKRDWFRAVGTRGRVRESLSVCRSGELVFLLSEESCSVRGSLLSSRRMNGEESKSADKEVKGRGYARPNQALEPTRLLVMPRADARVTPSSRVAHL